MHDHTRPDLLKIDEARIDEFHLLSQALPDTQAKKHRVIEKITAQVGITYSNSLVEAQNKIVKNNYLKMMDISSLKQLEEKLEFTIQDYNHVRPHISLKGLTPFEAFYSKKVKLLDNKDSVKNALLLVINVIPNFGTDLFNNLVEIALALALGICVIKSILKYLPLHMTNN